MPDDDLRQRAAELHAEHRRLRRQLADIAEYSAEVHEEAARVHDELPGARLDPAALREHARRDRDLAAQERASVEDDEDADGS